MTKNIIKTVILISFVSILSCIRASTPDDDLIAAVALGDVAAVQQALDRGASVNRVYPDGTTALILACKRVSRYHGEGHANVEVAVKADLESRKADVSGRVDKAFQTRSSKETGGDPEIVKLLLARGADVNARDRDGKTALMLARSAGMSEIVELLKKAGAKD